MARYDFSDETACFELVAEPAIHDGVFTKFSGCMTIPGADLETATLTVEIDVRSLMVSGEESEDEELRAEYFEAEKFPRARLVSRSFRKLSEHGYEIAGELTLHGVTRQVSADGVLALDGETDLAAAIRLAVTPEDHGVLDGVAVLLLQLTFGGPPHGD